MLELAAVEPNGLARLTAGDTPEAAALAGHLAGCRDCTQELARLRRVAGVVRGVVRTTPPPELRDRTLAFVRAVGRDRSAISGVAATRVTASGAAAIDVPQLTPAIAVTPPHADAVASRGRWPQLAALAAALVLAVAGVGFGIAQSNEVAQRDAVIRQQADVASDLASVTEWTLRVGARPDARRVQLVSTGAGAATGTLLFSPATRELVVVADGLSSPPAGHEYRCWVDVDGTRKNVGKMFFGGGMSYWVGPVDAVGGLSGPARFGVSLVQLGTGDLSAEPVLSGEL